MAYIQPYIYCRKSATQNRLEESKLIPRDEKEREYYIRYTYTPVPAANCEANLGASEHTWVNFTFTAASAQDGDPLTTMQSHTKAAGLEADNCNGLQWTTEAPKIGRGLA